MANKSDKNRGGRRTASRQNMGELSVSGALSALGISFIPEGVVTGYQMALMGIVFTSGLGMLAKILRNKGILPEMTEEVE